jgi:hypothetical protein
MGRRCFRKHILDELNKRERICEICRDLNLIYIHPFPNPLEIDHKISLSEGGSDDPNNLRWVCRFHNRNIKNNGTISMTEAHRTRFTTR